MPKLLDQAKIVDINNGEYMGAHIAQFRAANHTTVGQIAKRLNIKPSKIYLLENGKIQDNKLMLKEANAIGMGLHHFNNLAKKGNYYKKHPKPAPRPLKKGTKFSNHYLRSIILDLVDGSPISLTELSQRVGMSKNYFYAKNEHMRPQIFVRCARIFHTSNGRIRQCLEDAGVPIDRPQIPGNRYWTAMIMHGYLQKELAQKTGLSVGSIRHLVHHNKGNYSVRVKVDNVLGLDPSKEPKKTGMFGNTHGMPAGTNIRHNTPLDSVLAKHGYKSMTQFSRESGISLPVISRIKLHPEASTVSAWSKVANKLGISYDDLAHALGARPAHSEHVHSKAVTHHGTPSFRLGRLIAEVRGMQEEIGHLKDIQSHAPVDEGRVKSLVIAEVAKQMGQQSKLSPQDAKLLDQIHSLFSHHSKAKKIVNALFSASDDQLGVLLAIVNTWK